MRFSTGLALAVNAIGFFIAAICLGNELYNPDPSATYVATTGAICFMTVVSFMGIAETDEK